MELPVLYGARLFISVQRVSMLPYVIFRVFCDCPTVTAESGVKKSVLNASGWVGTSLRMEGSLLLSSQHALLVRPFVWTAVLRRTEVESDWLNKTQHNPDKFH